MFKHHNCKLNQTATVAPDEDDNGHLHTRQAALNDMQSAAHAPSHDIMLINQWQRGSDRWP